MERLLGGTEDQVHFQNLPAPLTRVEHSAARLRAKGWQTFRRAVYTTSIVEGGFVPMP